MMDFAVALFPFPFHSALLPPSPSRICSGLTRGCLGQRPVMRVVLHRKFGLGPLSKGRSREWSGLWQAMPLSTIPQLGHPKPAVRSAHQSQTLRGVLVRRQTRLDGMARAHQGHQRRTLNKPPEDRQAEDSVHLARWWHRIARQYREAPFRQAEGSLCRRTRIDQKGTAAFGKPRYGHTTTHCSSLEPAASRPGRQQPSDTWNEPGAGLPGSWTAHSAGPDDA